MALPELAVMQQTFELLHQLDPKAAGERVRRHQCGRRARSRPDVAGEPAPVVAGEVPADGRNEIADLSDQLIRVRERRGDA